MGGPAKKRGPLAVLRIFLTTFALLAIYKALLPEDVSPDEKPAMTPYIAPEDLKPQAAQEPASSPPAGGPALDLTRPLQTTAYAVICDEDVLFRALASHRAQDDFSKVYDAFESVFGRSEKVRAAGCEEWKGGIPAYHASRMPAPFSDFIEFSTSPDGDHEYFTMPSHLENATTAAE